MVTRRLRVVMLAAALFVVAPARADSAAENARAHFDAGMVLYQQGFYDDALVELKAAYKLDPRPELLYSLGQTERKGGHCKEALDYYQRYLDGGLPRERAAAVLVQMDRCRAELEHPAPSPSPPVIAPAPPIAAPPVAAPIVTAPPPPRSKPVYKRWWLWTSVAVVAAAGVGLGVGLTLGRSSDFKGTLPDLVVK